MDVIPDLAALDNVGVVGMSVFLVLCFVMGWIVSGKQAQARVDDKQVQIDVLVKANLVKDAQIESLTNEVGRTLDSFLTSIRGQIGSVGDNRVQAKP